MITQLQKGKNYFCQISLAMLVAMISIVGCTKKNETPKPTPVITDFKATSGWVGDVVIITGTDFGIDAASNIVKFGDKVATVSAATITELKVTVPAGATTGKISVTVNSVVGTSTTNFTVNTETVYICGNIAKNNKGIAGYWKNNTFVSLTDGTKIAFANAIAVVGNDVYVAGTEGDPMTSGKIAKYWKNGVATILSVQNAEVTGMTIVGNDVYVAGTEIGASLKFVAKYWKNGIATILSDGSINEYTGNIVVNGSDIYVLSRANIANGVSKYWKNGNAVTVATNTNNGTSLVASNLVSMAIEGNDVYIGGSYSEGIPSNNNYYSVYWKNNVRTSLLDGRIAALTVIGGIVHSVGVSAEVGTNKPIPKYWRNEVNTTLDSNQSTLYSFAEAIAVIGGDVYIAGITQTGSSIYSPRYWKNGVGINVGDGIDNARVTGIVVIP